MKRGDVVKIDFIDRRTQTPLGTFATGVITKLHHEGAAIRSVRVCVQTSKGKLYQWVQSRFVHPVG